MRLGIGLRVLLAFMLGAAMPAVASSVYTQRPDDKAAVYLTKDEFDVHADGVDDDSAALQAAIDRVQETTVQGIVFVPEGRYRVNRTIFVWPGVRLIGYGAHRPVLVLAPNTPGFQTGVGYIVFFTGGRPVNDAARASSARGRRGAGAPLPGTVPAGVNVIDANPGTFYSAMSNIDFEIGDGNPAAVGIRFHVAQHCFLSHMDFHIGSGLAALNDIGNEAEDLHFFGGQYGIITQKPSPGWQFTLLDSSFEGQREAAIREHEAGLTLVRDRFSNVPSVVAIDAGYAEELWIEDTRFERISGPAIVISNEENERTEINLKDIICRNVPTLAEFRKSGKIFAGRPGSYRVREFSHGLQVAIGGKAEIGTVFQSEPLAELPELPQPAIGPLPDRARWLNLRTLGAKGDGVTDDTAAIEAAIAKYPVLYVPSGRYLVSRTIALRPDTVLIGLHPSTTQFDLADHTPGFDGPGGPVALLTTPSGGSNIVTGIGLYTGGVNSRAAAAMWRAGKSSWMDDVRFLGGHGTNAPNGSRINPYNSNHTGDQNSEYRWDGQYPSLWVLDGGGGTFADIWTPNTFAQAGLYVSNTATEGHVYELSSEHHVRMEVKLDHVSNWELAALQTEEEHGEGGFALPLEIDNSRNILVANMHSYRVVAMQQAFPYAVKVAHSQNVSFRNLHVDSDSKVSFDDSVFDQDSGQSTRFRELEALTVSDAVSGARAVAAKDTQSVSPKRLATGFFNIAGATVDASGAVYFVDAHWQKIYRWSARKGLEKVLDAPIDAANLAMDREGELLAVSYAGNGTVYRFKPDDHAEELTLIRPEAAQPRPGMTAFLPVDYWNLRSSAADPTLLHREFQYVSPDGSTFLPAGRDFVDGALYYGTKMADVLRSFALAKAEAGKPFYVTAEEEHKTYVANVAADGTLGPLKLFAERGGEGVVAGPDGKVYVAAGEVYVYSPAGKLLETIDVAERPIDLIFGGTNGRTLFILAKTSLYSVER